VELAGVSAETTAPISTALRSIEGSYDRVNSFDRTYVPGEPIYNTLLEMAPERLPNPHHGPVSLTYTTEQAAAAAGSPGGSPAPHAPGSADAMAHGGLRNRERQRLPLPPGSRCR